VFSNEVLIMVKAAVSYWVSNFFPSSLGAMKKNTGLTTSCLVLSLSPASRGFGRESEHPLGRGRHGGVRAAGSSRFFLADGI